jgi:DhnA family fructose-bisphosphate aldolase class Ia
MHEGKQRRLKRIFAADGRTLVVAMDHAAFMPDLTNGLEQPASVIKAVYEAGADAVMTTLGTVRACADAIGPNPLILSMANNSPYLDRMIEEAVTLGVDMLKCMAFPFYDKDPDSLVNLQRFCVLANHYAIPVMGESIPAGWAGGPDWRTAAKIAAGARVTVEAGADLVKTFFTEDGDYRQVIKNTPAPVVVLGGEKASDPRPFLEGIARSLDAGAKGVAIGRNVWAHPEPGVITRAIAAVVHKGASIDEALKLLK